MLGLERLALYVNFDRPVDGARSITFRLYESPDGEAPVWTEEHADVDVVDGVLDVVLGDLVPLPAAAATRLYLGVQVEGDEELAPRMTVGGALRAQWAAVAARALDVDGRAIHPATVNVGGQLVIDEAGRWVGDAAGLEGPPGADGAPGPAGARGEPGPRGPAGPGLDGPVDALTVRGNLTVGGTIDAAGGSFHVTTTDLVLKGRTGGAGRALVDRGGRLVLNYDRDFPDGVSTPGSLDVGGALDTGGSVTADVTIARDNGYAVKGENRANRGNTFGVWASHTRPATSSRRPAAPSGSTAWPTATAPATPSGCWAARTRGAAAVATPPLPVSSGGATPRTARSSASGARPAPTTPWPAAATAPAG